MDIWTSDQKKAFGARLRDARKARAMTLADVGAIFDSPKQTPQHWEAGRNMPTAEQLAILAEEYKESAEYLLYGRRQPKTELSELEARVLGMLRAMPTQDQMRMVNLANAMILPPGSGPETPSPHEASKAQGQDH